MTDTVDTSKEAVERIKGSIYFGADWCQWHPDYYEGFTGPVDKIDTSHGLSVVMGGERTKAGDLAGADMAGYLQDCANMVPKLLAERDLLLGQLDDCHALEAQRRKHTSDVEAERDQLRREVEEARNAALEEAIDAVHQECWTDGPMSETLLAEQSTTGLAIRAIEALKSEPAPRQSVQEAARVLLDACPNPVFDNLKPILMGEFHQTYPFFDEDGDEVTAKVNISWTVTKDIISAALRALAQKESE